MFNTVTSSWARLRLKSTASQLFTQCFHLMTSSCGRNICHYIIILIIISVLYLHRCSPWMDMWFHPTLYNGCNYLFIRGSKFDLRLDFDVSGDVLPHPPSPWCSSASQYDDNWFPIPIILSKLMSVMNYLLLSSFREPYWLHKRFMCLH